VTEELRIKIRTQLLQHQVELWRPYDSEDPGEIYHYTSTQGLLGIIESHAIRASDITCFNDTSEGRYALSVAQPIVRAKSNVIHPQIVEDFCKFRVLSGHGPVGAARRVFLRQKGSQSEMDW
jgi:hypothetical protein